MLHHTRGIVFHQVKYSDSAIVARFYTEQFGLYSYLIRGLRSRKSLIKPALLQPLTLLEMVVDHKEKRDVQHLKEMKISFPFKTIPYDIRKSSIVVFINEILYNVIREQETNPGLFEFIYHSIARLDEMDQGVADFHLNFLIQLTKYLGFYPKNNFTETNNIFDLQEGYFISKPLHDSASINYPYSKYFSELIANDSSEGKPLYHSHSERLYLLGSLLKYYYYHVPDMREIKSHYVLQSVLND